MIYKRAKECKKCEKCNKWRELLHFLEREDRKGLYAFCNDCMKEQGREPGYPSIRERGGGNLRREPKD